MTCTSFGFVLRSIRFYFFAIFCVKVPVQATITQGQFDDIVGTDSQGQVVGTVSTDNCACSPNRYTFSLVAFRSCPNENRPTGSGIVQVECSGILSLPLPATLFSFTFTEKDLYGNVLATDSIPVNDLAVGSSISVDSIVSEAQIPRTVEIELKAKNEVGEESENFRVSTKYRALNLLMINRITLAQE
jgi:hypothetical protein